MFVVVNMSTHVTPMPYLSEPKTPAITPYQILHMAHAVADLAYDDLNELVTGLSGIKSCCNSDYATYTEKWQRQGWANIYIIYIYCIIPLQNPVPVQQPTDAMP